MASKRWIPIRDAIKYVLQIYSGLANTTIETDNDKFSNLALTQYPAICVTPGLNSPGLQYVYCGNVQDHTYIYTIRVAVTNFKSASDCDDDLFTLIELVQDALKESITLNGLVSYCYAGEISREISIGKSDQYWYSEATIAVTCSKTVV